MLSLKQLSLLQGPVLVLLIPVLLNQGNKFLTERHDLSPLKIIILPALILDGKDRRSVLKGALVCPDRVN